MTLNALDAGSSPAWR